MAFSGCSPRHLDWIKLCPNIYNIYYWNRILLNMLYSKFFIWVFLFVLLFFFSTRNYWYKWINVGKYLQPGLLQSVGSQRVGHNWVTEQQQILRAWHRKLYVKMIWVCQTKWKTGILDMVKAIYFCIWFRNCQTLYKFHMEKMNCFS